MARLDRDPAPADSSGGEGETLSAPPPAGRRILEGPIAIGEVLASRYVVRAELGRGGAGVVYQAFDRRADQWVAIKVLDPYRTSEPASSEHLYRELRVGRSLAHPNVCRTYEVFEAEGRCFLVMEYASGGTLRTSLGDGGGDGDRPFADQLTDARGVIAGLAAIHGAGMVHRDLKPENILRMADGRLVVSDFGLARALEQASLSTALGGTPGYLAPEVTTGGRITPASDVWALGVVLHEILAGVRPAWTERRLSARLAEGRGVDPGYRALARVCLRCLAADPGRRPSSAGEVERLLEDLVRAAPRGPRRWRVVAAFALLVLPAALLLMPGRPVPPPARPAIQAALDRGADWSRAPVIGTGNWECLQPLPPDGRLTRVVVTRRPPQALDVDLSSGRSRPAPLLPEAFQEGCPRLSPDGNTMLFPRRARDGHMTIMLSRRPDGGQAVALTQGTGPAWLPSGTQFLFVTESQALALGGLDGRVTLFAGGERTPERFLGTAADSRGELVAALADHTLTPGAADAFSGPRPDREVRLALYDVRTMRYLRSWLIKGRMLALLDFDPARQTFLTGEQRGSHQVLVELKNHRDLVPVGHIPNAEVLSAVRTGAGLAVNVFDQSLDRSMLLRPDGSEAVIEGAEQTDVSAAGDLVLRERSRRSGLHGADPTRVFFQRAGSSERQVLGQGIGIGWPIISIDGETAAYFDWIQGRIFRCDLPRDRPPACKLAHTDTGLNLVIKPGPLAPDGDTLPYFSVHGNAYTAAHSLRLLSLRSGLVRDLGPIDARCQPVWTGRTFWIRSKVGPAQFEIDAQTGKRTSRTRPVDAGAPCPSPPGEIKKPWGLRRELGFQWRLVDDRAPSGPSAGERL